MNTNPSEHFKLLRSRDFLIGLAIGIGTSAIAIAAFAMVGLSHKNDLTRANLEAGVQDRTSEVQPVGEPQKSPQQPIDSLAKLDAYTSDFARRVVFYTLIEHTSEDELVGLLRESKNIDSDYHRNSIQIAIARKFTGISPDRALAKLRELSGFQQIPFVAGLAREWSSMALADCVTNLETLNPPLRLVALKTILQSQDDLPQHIRHEISQRFGYENFPIELAGEQVAQSLVDSPDLAWSAIVKDQLVDLYQIDTLVQVAERWALRDGGIVVSHVVTDSPLEYKWTVLRQVVAAISSIDPRGAFEHGNKLPQTERYQLLPVILKVWANDNPADAIAALVALNPNREGFFLKNTLISSLVSSNPRGILANLEQIPEQLQLEAAEKAVSAIVQTAPQEAIQLLGNLRTMFDDISTISNAMVRRWSLHDPNAALNWVLSEVLESNSKREDMIRKAIEELTPKDPVRAFDVASAQPLGKYGGLEVRVIRELCKEGKNELAIEFLSRVRSESKLDAAVSIGDSLVRNSDPDRAIKLIGQLPEQNRGRYVSSIAYTWSNSDPLQLFDQLSDLPEEIKSTMARALLSEVRSKPVLTKEQILFSKSLLNEDDRKEVESWNDL